MCFEMGEYVSRCHKPTAAMLRKLGLGLSLPLSS